MALPVAYYRAKALSVPAINLSDRRTAEQRVTRWAILRDLEAVLYGSIDTSTGAVHRLMGRESLCVDATLWRTAHCKHGLDALSPSFTCRSATALTIRRAGVNPNP